MPGKVSVFVRVRPLVGRESHPVIAINEEENEVTCSPTSETQVMKEELKLDYGFQFERVFGEKSTIESIYRLSLSHLIKDFMAGHNASVFCCGNATSGKTQTIFGEFPREEGLLSRIAQDLFARDDLSYEDVKVHISVVEISHSGGVVDLLEAWPRPTGDVISHEVLVRTAKEFRAVVNHAQRERCVNISINNEKALHGVRSSAVVRVHRWERVQVKGKEKIRHSALCVVDLAGSVVYEGSIPDMATLKEMTYINNVHTSIQYALRAVEEEKQPMETIVTGSPLLQYIEQCIIPNRGRKARSVLIGTVSPDNTQANNSLQTLRYLERAFHLSKRIV
jgi:hypothetical protein